MGEVVGVQMVQRRGRPPYTPSHALVTFASPLEAVRARGELEGLVLGDVRITAELLPDTVHDMILYIYSGKVAEVETKATGLLSAAEKYDLKELKTMCETALCDTITQDNVLDLLVLADLHGASSVRGLALKFIVDNGKEIVAQQGWRDKLKAYPEIMADMFEAMTRQPAKRQRLN